MHKLPHDTISICIVRCGMRRQAMRAFPVKSTGSPAQLACYVVPAVLKLSDEAILAQGSAQPAAPIVTGHGHGHGHDMMYHPLISFMHPRMTSNTMEIRLTIDSPQTLAQHSVANMMGMPLPARMSMGS